ncbi:hypothetical protein BV22DRAFT_1001461 [Leucogyrophana mollusca]|uniref:Uncharacterized protein n=1 Tax=Leucogyrophana mollusca TaxID=85980 RepID=A0ACB8BVN8_9AGAM|nr:hypothetical protein BV22DRAFT_1001461 [Leucogyrophana mollusca]
MGPSSACQSVAKRIRQVLRDIHCPELVVIHAFWYILQLTSSTDDKASAFTFYHFLYQHGARTVDEVMLHAFIAAAMVSDKWVNDHSFAAKTWYARKFSGIPVATLNTTEIFMLKRLAWKTEIPTDQWRLWLEQLQNWGGSTARNGSLPQGSTSPRAIVDTVLDHMLLQDVARSHAPQPHHSVPHTSGGAPDAPMHAYKPDFISAVPSLPGPADWCPEADPVVEPTSHRQPVLFAPGAHRISVGQLSHDIASFPHTPPAFQYGRSMPLGTSFAGPFGAIGTRLANGLTSVHNGPWLATASGVPWITAQG